MEFLVVIAMVLLVVGGIWMLIETFKVGLGWGLACLFIPFVSLAFIFLHWDVAKRPFFVNLTGLVLIFIGAGMSA